MQGRRRSAQGEALTGAAALRQGQGAQTQRAKVGAPPQRIALTEGGRVVAADAGDGNVDAWAGMSAKEQGGA